MNPLRSDQFESNAAELGQFQQLVLRIYASSGLAETAFNIANEGRNYLNCDRLSVASWVNGRARLLSVSSVVTIESRAKQVRELESLVAVAMQSRREWIFPTQLESPQEVEGKFGTYLDSTGCESIRVIPILDQRAKSRESEPQKVCLGAIVIEQFSTGRNELSSTRLELFLPHAVSAFVRESEIEGLPLRPLVQKLQWLAIWIDTFKIRSTMLVVGTALAICGAIFFRSDLNIEAQGNLQPFNLRHIFAPANGEIVRVSVKYREKVNQGDPLLALRSPELELRREELMTEMGVTLEKLRSVEAARIGDRKSLQTEAAALELSATERELREIRVNQEKQLQILKEMINALDIKSPIGGSVISWNPSETLERRPVRQGQRLMSVAALDASGVLELNVLDEDIRHVIDASQSQSQPLAVSFSIASDPGRKHMAQVARIGTVVRIEGDRPAHVQVEAIVQLDDMKHALPGARVVARIHCGKAAVGYIWTRRLWDYFSLHGYWRFF